MLACAGEQPREGVLVQEEYGETVQPKVKLEQSSHLKLNKLKKEPLNESASIAISSEDDEETEDEEEVPGMSLKKKKEEEVVPFRVGDKERKAINR